MGAYPRKGAESSDSIQVPGMWVITREVLWGGEEGNVSPSWAKPHCGRQIPREPGISTHCTTPHVRSPTWGCFKMSTPWLVSRWLRFRKPQGYPQSKDTPATKHSKVQRARLGCGLRIQVDGRQSFEQSQRANTVTSTCTCYIVYLHIYTCKDLQSKPFRTNAVEPW